MHAHSTHTLTCIHTQILMSALTEMNDNIYTDTVTHVITHTFILTYTHTRYTHTHLNIYSSERATYSQTSDIILLFTQNL